MALKPSIEPIIWSDLQRLEEYRQASKSSGLYLIGSQHDAVSPITQTVDMPRSRCMDKEQSKTRHIAASRTAAGEKRSMRTAVKREQRRLAIKKPSFLATTSLHRLDNPHHPTDEKRLVRNLVNHVSRRIKSCLACIRRRMQR